MIDLCITCIPSFKPLHPKGFYATFLLWFVGSIATLSPHKFHIFDSHDMPGGWSSIREGTLGADSVHGMTLHGAFMVVMRETGELLFFSVLSGLLDVRKSQMAKALTTAGIASESRHPMRLLAYQMDGLALWIDHHQGLVMSIAYTV